MITYIFECPKGHLTEKFRFGLDRLDKWKAGKLKIECEKCGSTELHIHIPKGSGTFKMDSDFNVKTNKIVSDYGKSMPGADSNKKASYLMG